MYSKMATIISSSFLGAGLWTQSSQCESNKLKLSFLTEVDLNDQSSKDESYDFRFVKWLIKEKVNIYGLIKSLLEFIKDEKYVYFELGCNFTIVFIIN